MFRTKVPSTERPLVTGRRRRLTARATIAVLPTLFTLGNLMSGCAAIFFASRAFESTADLTRLPWGWTPLKFAASFIFLGMAFDGLDGRIARMTSATSELGEQLDSMADMVTFGVAPAFLAVQLARVGLPFIDQFNDLFFERLMLVIAGIYACCTALRLARFNIEVGRATEVDHSSFSGLPSPGAAGTVASLILLHQLFLAREDSRGDWTLTASSVAMSAVMLLVAFAMVSRLRYVHVVNRYFRNRMKLPTLALLVAVLLLLLTKPQIALAAGFTTYALSAPVMWVVRRFIRKPPAEPTTVHE